MWSGNCDRGKRIAPASGNRGIRAGLLPIM
jgi:hypothetical protein